MRKSIFFGAIVMATVFLLAGCGVNPDKKDKDDSEPVINNELEKEGNSAQSGDGYGFREFDLEIEVDNKDVIDIEFDVNDEDEIKGKYENKLTDTRLKGKAAMDEIHKLFMDVLLDKDMADDVAIDKITKYLRIDNYSKFELDVEFNDKTEREIKDVK